MYVTDSTQYTVIRLVGNDTRPFIDRFDSHQEAHDFAMETMPESRYCCIETVRTQREVLREH